MSNRDQEGLLRASFAPARRFEPSPSEVAAAMARAGAARRSTRPARTLGWRRLVIPAVAALALLAGLYAVPGTRAAIDEIAATVAETFSGYSRGDSAAAPGRPLHRDEAKPEYFGDRYGKLAFARNQRVLAEAGGYKLFAYRAPSGSLSFDLGDTGIGMGFEGVDEIGPGAIYILGPGAMDHADAQGHVPLFGLAADSIASVELVYGSGSPLRVDRVRGGFVLLAQPDREPREVLGLDAAGGVLARESVAKIGWGQFLASPR
jgi:hypothetical protein